MSSSRIMQLLSNEGKLQRRNKRKPSQNVCVCVCERERECVCLCAWERDRERVRESRSKITKDPKVQQYLLKKKVMKKAVKMKSAGREKRERKRER